MGSFGYTPYVFQRVGKWFGLFRLEEGRLQCVYLTEKG